MRLAAPGGHCGVRERQFELKMEVHRDLLFEMPDCGGCRTCELAGRFQHTGEFYHSASSPGILDKPDRRGYTVQSIDQAEGTHLGCHGRQHLAQPLCVLHCREAEELTRIIAEFIRVAQREVKPKTEAQTARPGSS